jgi:phosphonate transport system permease protein
MPASLQQPQLRDPDALRRAGWVLLALLVLWPLMQIAEFRPADLFEARNLEVMGGFLGQFFPPNLNGDFLAFALKATIETLAMATAGTALAMVLALPLGLVLTHSLSVSRIGPGPDRGAGEALRTLARMALLILRGIPELVWALLLVRAFGLGPAAGVLAIGLTYGGMLGKVYSEILESGDTRPARVLLESGSGRLMAFFYGLLPGAGQELASYTIYRWECAVRASVIMGFVGAGGLGQLMDQSMKMLNGGEVSTILVIFLLLVLLADAISNAVRRTLA